MTWFFSVCLCIFQIPFWLCQKWNDKTENHKLQMRWAVQFTTDKISVRWTNYCKLTQAIELWWKLSRFELFEVVSVKQIQHGCFFLKIIINIELFLCLIFLFISFFVDVCYRIRGTLCTILVLGSTGGVLLGFIAGHFLEYAEAPRFALIFPILYIAFFSFMPETPYYLMKTNRMEVRLTFTCSLIFSSTVFFFIFRLGFERFSSLFL